MDLEKGRVDSDQVRSGRRYRAHSRNVSSQLAQHTYLLGQYSS